MAAIMGKDCDVKIGSTTLSFDTWSINPTFNTADITKFGNKTKVNAQTVAEWTAEASGTLDLANAQQVALLDQFKAGAGWTAVTFRGYTSSSGNWYGSAIVSNAQISASVVDKVPVTISFMCAGDLNRT